MFPNDSFYVCEDNLGANDLETFWRNRGVIFHKPKRDNIFTYLLQKNDVFYIVFVGDYPLYLPRRTKKRLLKLSKETNIATYHYYKQGKSYFVRGVGDLAYKYEIRL